MPRLSALTTTQWETVKLAYVAGTDKRAILACFPGLSWEALKKASQRGKWPVPHRVLSMARERAIPAQSPTGPQSCPQTSVLPPSRDISALELTLEATKGARMASLAGFSGRAVAVVDKWDIPTPRDMAEGLALVRSLVGLDRVGGSQTNIQVNISSAGPWGRKAEEPMCLEEP